MFAADVAMPAPGTIAYGSQKAIEALKSNPANAGAKAGMDAGARRGVI